MPYPMSSPVPLPNPLDDPEMYAKYANEAFQRLSEITNKQRTMMKNSRAGLLGKAGAVGGRMGFYKTKDPNNVEADNLRAGDAAYDHIQNMLESEKQDQQARMAEALVKFNATKTDPRQFDLKIPTYSMRSLQPTY